MSLRSFNLYDMFQRNAFFYQDRPALSWSEGEMGFGRLLAQCNALSAGLNSLGLHKGDRIAVLAQNSYHFFPLFGAASCLGLTLVLINRRLSLEEIKYTVQDTSPLYIFGDEENKDMVGQLVCEHFSLKDYFIFGPSGPNSHRYQDLLQDEDFQPENTVERKDPFLIIHTAAIQGKPRGAVLSQENMILSSLQLIASLKLSQDDVYLNFLPLFHIMGINLGLSVMHAGGKNIVIPKFDPALALENIEKHKVSILGTFPPIISNLLTTISDKNVDLSSIRHVLGLDQPENIKNWQDATGSCFWTLYGQTETSGIISLAPFDEKPGSAGRPGYLVNLSVVDEFDSRVPLNQKGEIVARGPLVFHGYWEQKELNDLTFREGWHHTGDIGMLDEYGYLTFAGRKAEKDLIKTGGENVFPVEVEKTILEHPDISEVSVIGVPDPKFGEGIKAICVLRPGSSITEQELKDFVGSKIAGYKKPRYVHFVSSLPKAEDQSIDREEVKRLYASS